MAEIKQPTVDDCGQPELPEGPYITYCAYEYIAFYECRGSGAQQNNSATISPIGNIGTYTEGGDGTSSGSVGFKNVSYTYAGNPIAVAYMGKLSSGWTDYFVDINTVNQGFVGQWFAAPQHNYLTNRGHIKIAKYIHVEAHTISKEDLYGENEPEEGNEIWECPNEPQFNGAVTPNNQDGGVDITMGTIPAPEAHDFGQDVCPKYFQLDPCVDCNGETDPELSSFIFEIQGGNKNIVTNNATIIEYPDESNNCYSFTEIQPQNQQGILPRNQNQGYDTFFDCDECKKEYWIVIISPVSAIDASLPTSLTWVPTFAVNIPRVPIGQVPPNNVLLQQINIAQALDSGNMSFFRMDKANQANRAFVQQLRGRDNPNEFVYKGQDGICRRGYIADPANCTSSKLDEWTHWKYNTSSGRAERSDDPHYITSSQITLGAQGVFYNDDRVCECLDQNGTVGPTNEKNCNPPPTITKHPEPVKIELSRKNEQSGKQFSLTFTVQATPANPGDNLQYKWFRSHQTGVTQLNSNTNTVTFSRGYKLSEGHDGINVNHFVYCEVSNDGGTPVRSQAAPIEIVRVPHKRYDDDKPTRLVTVKVWCLSQRQANSMKAGGIVAGIKTPENAGLRVSAVQTKYIDPDQYDANAGDNYYIGKYFIQTQGEGACRGADHVVYKVTSIRVTPWENVSNAFKGVSNPANDDEQRIGEFILPVHAISKKEWQTPGGDADTGLSMNQNLN